MCGIAGIYGLSSIEKNTQAIQQMTNVIKHRGPDNQATFIEANIALGHTRLSIIEPNASGNQPMQSPDSRYTIVYNGELYNYKALKTQIKNYSFQTETDTEVILAAYIQWGNNCLNRFNGMFAFAIWDNDKQELFIARDRMGIKPIYHTQAENGFLFASEIRAIMQSGLINTQLNENSILEFLDHQTVYAPNTILKNVLMLMPGHYLTLQNNILKTESYWDIKEQINYVPYERSYDEVCKHIKHLMFASVEKRLISDVPYGAFLSGGIDSSAIVGIMSKLNAGKTNTFTVTFDESEFSEVKYAEQIAKLYKTNHHEIKLKPLDLLNELPNALNSMDHPSGDGPNTYLISKSIRAKGIKMALSGLGGDEVFAGYDVFKQLYKLNQNRFFWSMSPTIFRKVLGATINLVKPSIASNKIAQLLSLKNFNMSNAHAINRQVFNPKQINELLNIENPKQSYLDFNIDNKHILSKVSIYEIQTYMQNTLLRDTDQMSMAHALEVRVPFLDHKLVSYVLGIQDKFKYPSTPKPLLTNALGDLIPANIINRKKMGFVLPWEIWLKNDLKDFCTEHLSTLGNRNFMNDEIVQNIWRDFLAGKKLISWSRIWNLVVLEHWIQKNDL